MRESGEGKPVTANAITAAILLGISERFSGRVVAWRNNRIDAMAKGRCGALRRVSAGINGQADITGILAAKVRGEILGVRLEIEVKAGKDTQSPSQVGYMNMIRDHGGIYIIARHPSQCLDEIGSYLP